MFEHMMFKGTKHVRPEAHAQFLNGIGGYVNAATDEDATHYINTLPADYLDFAIQLEAERMRNLMFRPEMIAVEREVVKEEIRQQENSPIAKGFLRFLDIAFTKHPYAWTAGGNIKDLDATTPDDLKKFYDAYYQPNNALLVVVGKTTAAAVKASAEKYFGPIAKSAEPPRPAAQAQEPEQKEKRREVVEAGQIGLLLVGFHIPPAKHKDIYALQVASIILGAGESSRLKLRLKAIDPKTKRPTALDGGMESVVREDPGMVVALGAYLDPAQGDGIEAAIFDEIQKMGAKGPTAEELRKAKNQVQSGFTFSLENAQGLAQAIGRSWILTGDASAFMRDVDEIEKVTAADVANAVKKYMAPNNATIVVIPPKGAAAAPAKGGK
jgi:zinc protease